MKRRFKRALSYASLLVLVACAVELLSFLVFRTFEDRFTFFEPADFARELEDFGRLPAKALIFHPQLGWDQSHETPYGERPRVVTHGTPLISSFGDSFTRGDQVGDHETWQTYLSELLEADVYNFGVGAYGTDQAYLKFLSKYPEVQTPIVTLGVITENINRIVNVYRPFYFPETGVPLTKPRFRLIEGELVLLENPLGSFDEIRRLKDAGFLHRIGASDWWYNRHKHPILQFPYSRILLNRRTWLELAYGGAGRPIDDIDPRPWANLWDVPEVNALMFELFESFVEEAEQSGATPIVMLLPQRHEVLEAWRTGRRAPQAAALMEECDRRGFRCFDAITALTRTVASEQEAKDLFRGHLSPAGNRKIAETFLVFLTESLGPLERLKGAPQSLSIGNTERHLKRPDH